MPKPKNIVRKIKRGRRIYGAVYAMSSGGEYYLAWRKQAEMFRSGEKSISDAVSAGTAAWALDDETLIDLRVQGIKIVGVWVKETNDIYLTKLSKFNDPKLAKVMNYESRGGALQRYLPITEFSFVQGAVRIK